MKSKKFLSLLFVLAVVFSLVSCGGADTAPNDAPGTSSDVSTPADGPTYVWRFHHGLATDHPYHIGATKFAELCAEKSGGRIQIDIFPGSQLGSERETYEMLQMGTLDFVSNTTSPLVNFDPSFAIFDMPFLFRDKQHAYSVLDGEIGDEKFESLENYGMHGLAWWECGMFNLVYSGDPIRVPDDMKGRTFRTMETEVTMSWVAATGANPVPMAWAEVFTALQNGTVDGTILPYTTTFFNKIYTVAPNYTLLNVTYSPVPLVISKQTWDPLPDDIKAILEEAAVESRDYMREYSNNVEAEIRQTMENEGVNLIDLTQEEMDQWVDTITEKAYPQLIPSWFSQDEVDRIQAVQ